ncbi:MAG: type II toxin-antitoxin system RelE/ParE family toxin [Candidatus Magnetobacterium sp. LHC-1]
MVLTKPAEKAYDKSTGNMQKRLDSCFEGLEKNPLYGNNIRSLTGKLKGLYRYRIGNWRVIYRIDNKHTIVEIIAILPRGDAYLT